jgi:Fe-S-cluster containining protein
MTESLDAGDFITWLGEMAQALRGERDADVPCETCTACCTSSQFVHIGPEETDALSHIPADLLFPAPRMPAGHVLMGYDERGHCPMLFEGACTIYEHRPRTCRTYDCRVFPAAGMLPEDPEKAQIAERARRWQFRYATPADWAVHDAVRAAAERLRDEHPEASTTQVAVRAVEVISR